MRAWIAPRGHRDGGASRVRGASPLRSRRGRGGYWGETDRICSAEDTYARVSRSFARMGITRVADITALDRIGLPVCIAVRPNSKALSVSQGKGLTLVEAKVSAAMESVETYHAENVRLPRLTETYARLRRRAEAVDPETLWLRPDSLYHEGLPLEWVRGVDLLRRRRVYVPYDLVHTEYLARPEWTADCFASDTNGLAAGNSVAEARIRALCELVERDAMSLSELRARSRSAAGRYFDLATVEDDGCRRLISLLDGAGIGVLASDQTSDIGVPSVTCMIYDREFMEFGMSLSVGGWGCDLRPERALSRALLEAVQSRATYIAGSRDDIFRSDFDPATRFLLIRNAHELSARAERSHDFRKLRSLAGPDPESDLATLLASLKRRGLGSAVAVDLTHEDLGIPVVRMIVPGIEPNINHPLYRPGPRGREITGEGG